MAAVLKQPLVSRKALDFGDGGAFPEIHTLQYPLGMGTRPPAARGNVLPVTVDWKGNVCYDAIVKQNENSRKIVYSKYNDIVPKIQRDETEEKEDEDDDDDDIEKTKAETKAALDKIVNARLCATQPKNVAKATSNASFIKYTPLQKSSAFNSGGNGRMIRMVEMQVDPLEPAKFKAKRIPRPSGSPPVPVLHSPPRPVTYQDKKDWKIPPCISEWKNVNGYTIPLEKRRLEHEKDREINADQFNRIFEALNAAERNAREATELRDKVLKEMARKEKDKKEQELRALAQKARAERSRMDNANFPIKETKEEKEMRLQRDEMRVERKRERASEACAAAASGKKTKMSRERERDVSERIALGQANVTAGGRGEVMYDQRLFNQEKGMSSGFVTDDQYNLYNKGLFNTSSTLSTLYKPKKNLDDEMYGGADEQLDKIKKTDRFKPERGFSGANEGRRDGPVEFEEPDLFGLDKFFSEIKKGSKAMEEIGKRGTMHATAGSSRR